MRSTLISVCLLLGQLVTGFYIQPDVLFFSEHPSSQLLVANSDLYLSCAVQLRSISDEEGGLTVPVVKWRVNNTSISEVFPEAVVSQNTSPSHILTSTLHIHHTSHLHTGTYHCNIVDGTDEYEIRSSQRGREDLCRNHPCTPYITASNPAVVTIMENSTRTQTVELHRCSSIILQCGSLLIGQGLRPVLEWEKGGALINSSTVYHVLSTGDLAVFHSTEEGVADTYRCVAVSGSNSVTIATYIVVEGGDSDSMSIQLASSPSSAVAEGESVDLILSTAGECIDHLYCVWKRSESLLCPAGSGDGSVGLRNDSHLEMKYDCVEHKLRIHSVSYEEDLGLYCCEMVMSEGGVVLGRVCLDVEVTHATPPHLSSSHNDTTITINTTLPANLTLHCTTHSDLAMPKTAHYWYFNGEEISSSTGPMVMGNDSVCDGSTFAVEEGGSLVVGSEEGRCVVGVYQCFARNQFGYAVATLRIVPKGVTNPPGIPLLREIPRPNQDPTKVAFQITWSPPSYPITLDHVKYSLDTGGSPILTETNSAEEFFGLYGWVYIDTLVVDAVSGRAVSEHSPYLWDVIQGTCYRQVLFPPKLNATCTEGAASVRWANNPLNYAVYSYGPEPGTYYINITCYLQDGSVKQTNKEFEDEGNTTGDEEIPLGTICEFRGAATPPNGDGYCLDPAAIQYDLISCQIGGYVELENSIYVVTEGDGSLEVCLTARGYNFSFEVISTYRNIREVVEELYVSTASERVCAEVEIEDNSAVEGDRSMTLSLSSISHGVGVGPSATVTILDDDEIDVGFNETSYMVTVGEMRGMCIIASGNLNRELVVNLSINQEDPDEDQRLELSHEKLVFNSSTDIICVHLNATGISEVVTVDLVLDKEPEERAISWTNKNVTVEIWPVHSEEKKSNNTDTVIMVIIIVVSVFVVMILVLGCLVVTLCVQVFRNKYSKLPRIPPEVYNPSRTLPDLLEVAHYPDNSSICEPLDKECETTTDIRRQDSQSLSSESVEIDLPEQVIPINSGSRDTGNPDSSTHFMSRNTSDSNNSNMSDGSHHDYIVDLGVKLSLMSNHCSATSTGQTHDPKDAMAKAELSARPQEDSGLGMDADTLQ